MGSGLFGRMGEQMRDAGRWVIRLAHNPPSLSRLALKTRNEMRFHLFFRQNYRDAPMFRVVAARPSLPMRIATTWAHYISFRDMNGGGDVPLPVFDETRSFLKDAPPENIDEEEAGDTTTQDRRGESERQDRQNDFYRYGRQIGRRNAVAYYLVPMRLSRYFAIAGLMTFFTIILGAVIDRGAAPSLQLAFACAAIIISLPATYYGAKIFSSFVRFRKMPRLFLASALGVLITNAAPLLLLVLGAGFLLASIYPDIAALGPAAAAFLTITTLAPSIIYGVLRTPILPIKHGLPPPVDLRYLRTGVSYRIRPGAGLVSGFILGPIWLSIFQINAFRLEPVFWGGRNTTQGAIIRAAMASLVSEDDQETKKKRLAGPFHAFSRYFFYCWAPVWTMLGTIAGLILLEAVTRFQAASLIAVWLTFTLIFWVFEWAHLEDDFDFSEGDLERLPCQVAPDMAGGTLPSAIQKIKSAEMTGAVAGLAFTMATALFAISQTLPGTFNTSDNEVRVIWSSDQ